MHNLHRVTVWIPTPKTGQHFDHLVSMWWNFWGCRHHRSFFDVRVFNAFAESNQSTSLAATFRKHEGEKRRAYEERVREVERGSFTPLVFSSLGGMGKAPTVMYRRLANLLSDKWNSSYSLIMGWLRCSLSFSLLRSSLMCLRGSRSSSGSPGVLCSC